MSASVSASPGSTSGNHLAGPPAGTPCGRPPATTSRHARPARGSGASIESAGDVRPPRVPQSRGRAPLRVGRSGWPPTEARVPAIRRRLLQGFGAPESTPVPAPGPAGPRLGRASRPGGHSPPGTRRSPTHAWRMPTLGPPVERMTTHRRARLPLGLGTGDTRSRHLGHSGHSAPNPDRIRRRGLLVVSAEHASVEREAHPALTQQGLHLPKSCHR